MAFDIEGKIAIVTGAARGIGRATALALADAGARAVVIADNRRDLARETAAAVCDRDCEGVSIDTDVADPESLERLISGVVERFGALHILHNNAGIGEGVAGWPAVSADRVAAIADVNFRGVVVATRLALEPIRDSGGGMIAHTASGAAFVPLPQQAVYAATKAGVVHFTRACKPLAESHGVRVGCVCPGVVATDMVQETGVDGPAAWLQGVIDSVEVLMPEQVAAAVIDLVRDPDAAGKVVQVENRPKR